MSRRVEPSPVPGASSGSLLTMEVRIAGKDPPQLSVAVTVASICTRRWLGGASTDGDKVTVTLCGGPPTGVPVQAPFTQVSLVVHALLSLHAPDTGVPRQVPVWHESSAVQGLKSLQDPVRGSWLQTATPSGDVQVSEVHGLLSRHGLV